VIGGDAVPRCSRSSQSARQAPRLSSTPSLDWQMSAGHRLKVSPARGGYITRVEVLDGKFLYAINVHTTGAAQVRRWAHAIKHHRMGRIVTAISRSSAACRAGHG